MLARPTQRVLALHSPLYTVNPKIINPKGTPAHVLTRLTTVIGTICRGVPSANGKAV
jgi:hypothetical protein